VTLNITLNWLFFGNFFVMIFGGCFTVLFFLYTVELTQCGDKFGTVFNNFLLFVAGIVVTVTAVANIIS
jgi:hypothetical protein